MRHVLVLASLLSLTLAAGLAPVARADPTCVVIGTTTFGACSNCEGWGATTSPGCIGLGQRGVVWCDSGNPTVDLLCVPFSQGNATETIPARSVSESVPAQSTPQVNSTSFTTPGVTTPATCQLAACSAPTTVPGLSTPPVSQCDPTVTVCAVQGPIPLTNSTTVPALCGTPLGAAACFPPTQVIAPQTVTTPAFAPIALTPALAVSASTTDVVLAVESHLGEFATIPPTDVGPVHACPTPPSQVCQSEPVPPSGSANGSVTLSVTVGSTTVQRTIVLP